MIKGSLRWILGIFVCAVLGNQGIAQSETTSSDINSRIDTQIVDAIRAVEDARIAEHGHRALDRFQETWNTRDPEVWATSLHFPHVRPSTGRFSVSPSAEEYAQGVDFERTLATGWHRSQWDSKRVLQVSEDKVHMAGQYTRYKIDGEIIWTNQVTYVVTKQSGKWGIQSRFGAGRTGLPPDQMAASATSALTAVTDYCSALNSRNPESWAATLHYPHVRLAAGTLEVWQTPEQYVAGLQPARQRSWFRTKLDSMEAVQVASSAVNVALQFSRQNSDGETLSTYEAVYLITKRGDEWGVQARSSFAP